MNEPTVNLDSRMESLVETSFSRWAFAMIFDWFVIFVTFLLMHALLLSTYVYPLFTRVFILIVGGIMGIVVIGSRQHALAVLGHDGTHGLITKPLWLNDLLAELFCLWPLVAGLDGYRKFHFAHHHNLGTPLDPELEHKILSAPEWDLPDKKFGITKRFFKDLLGLGFNDILLVEHFIGMLRKGMSPRDLFGPIMWWIIVGAVIIYFKIWWVLLIWFVSVGTSFWAFFRVRMWTEHMGTPNVHRIAIRWWHRIFVPHNTWHHYEHHRFSRVPFFNLPRARELDTDEPIKTVDEIFASYILADRVPSGTPLHSEIDERFTLKP